jgi:Fe-S-cluster-containing hydrogenase component 2
MVLTALDGRAPTSADIRAAEVAIDRAVNGMGRTMPTDDLPRLLIDNPEHPRWASVASRCLTCANCTMVCPTCFCSTNTDSVGLDGVAVRTRSWDSCFDLEFSGLHGHPVRSSPRSRYRQWMTHKLATWHDQFGSSGCVGCGRCITWCPVGIDITEEVTAMSNGGQP